MRYVAIRSEGGLLPYDLLDKIVADQVTGQKPTDFGLPKGQRLIDEISRVWADAQNLWSNFKRRRQSLTERDPYATSITRSWVVSLLSDPEMLGFDLKLQTAAVVVNNITFAISHRDRDGEDAVPVHIEGCKIDLDRRLHTKLRTSPQAMLQDFLNNSEQASWGILTNGVTLRLLRDSSRTSRPTYLEFDLESTLEGNRFNEFALFYRLCHRSRFPKPGQEPSDCLLEKYYLDSIEQGLRIRDKLRDGVEETLKILGTAFLQHPANEKLRADFATGRLTAEALHRQLLLLVYRLLFLMVAEERGLIVAVGDNADRNQKIYDEWYAVTRLRDRASRVIEACPFVDVWIGLKQTFSLFEYGLDSNALGIPPLNGDLFNEKRAIPDLAAAELYNHELLVAVRHLSLFKTGNSYQRVSYSGLDVEELGSVYESLLDYKPVITQSDRGLMFDLRTGTERKSTGSYYTRPELVHELVESALVPVMGQRLSLAEEASSGKNLIEERDAREKALLSLRICDPACGSGHFLLAAARRVGKELARVRTGEDEPRPQDFHLAVRDVISHCLYGVDLNPLAVDLCKLALWLEGHWAGKPLSFLDHRIRCGNSLIGIYDQAVMMTGIPDEAFVAVAGDDKKVAAALKKRNKLERSLRQRALDFDLAEDHVAEYVEERRRLEAISDESAATVRQKSELYSSWRSGMQHCHDEAAADLWTAQFFIPLTSATARNACTTDEFLRFAIDKQKKPLQVAEAQAKALQNRFFHWHLEFPEIFAEGGFDVIIGNPPFLGGLKISENFGPFYRKYLDFSYSPVSGKADLCSLFFRRAFSILRMNGHLGLVATNTIAQGDTRESGLALLVKNGAEIYFAKRHVKWLGDATVEVDLIALSKGPSHAERHLDGEVVETISSRLDTEPEAEVKRLPENHGISFQGSIVLGMGFILDEDEAHGLLAQDARNKDCLFPYLVGDDVNSRCDQSPSRWIIQFDERNEREARSYPALWKILEERVAPERKTKDAAKYPRMVNEWWKHWNNRQELYAATSKLTRCLVRSRVSELHMVAFVPTDIIYSDALVVFAYDDYAHFAILQSQVHEAWVRRNASTMRTDVRYTPTDCFETFPFPDEARIETAEECGERFYVRRQRLLGDRQLGLTKLYNLMNDPDCYDDDVVELRELQGDMERKIFHLYGWDDLDPSLRFHPNDRGHVRFTIGPEVRRDVLRRLIAQNGHYATGRQSQIAAAPAT